MWIGEHTQKGGERCYISTQLARGRLFHRQLEGDKSSLTDKNAGGFLKHKPKSKAEENDKAILECRDFGPISYEWMFRILRDK